MHRVGHRLIPGNGIRSSHPALGQMTVFVGWKNLQRSHHNSENETESGCTRHAPIEPSGTKDEVQPGASRCEHQKYGLLVMAAEPGNSQKCSRQDCVTER